MQQDQNTLSEKVAIKSLRQDLQFKANLVRKYKEITIRPSTKRTTEPKPFALGKERQKSITTPNVKS